MALSDQLPAAQGHHRQQQASTIGGLGWRFVADRLTGHGGPVAAAIPAALGAGARGLPLIEAGHPRQLGAQGAPATAGQMGVTLVEGDQAAGQMTGLGLGQAALGGAAGLDLQAGMGHQLGPFALPVAISSGPEAGHVGRGHIGGDRGSLQLGPVLGQQPGRRTGHRLRCLFVRGGDRCGGLLQLQGLGGGAGQPVGRFVEGMAVVAPHPDQPHPGGSGGRGLQQLP